MVIHSAPLAATVADLRSNAVPLAGYLDEMSERIAQVDPQIQAFLPEPDRGARLAREGRQLVERYPAPATRPPLFGALVGIKDIIHIDGLPTRAGSELPPARLAGAEGTAVQRLRGAGALLAGKTVTTEFAYFEPGPTRNPHRLDHTPGGSSSGSAAAVAAGLCVLALGTQTIGSVIRPAAFCGIIGFKPTYERLPAAGTLYFSRTLDHVGLFTQDLAGMKLAASVLCDGWREASAAAVTVPPVLGVPTGPYLAQTEGPALAAFEAHLAALAQAGVTIVRVPALADIGEFNARHRRLAFGEFAREHAELYADFAPRYRPRTAEIIEIGQTVTDGELAELRLSCERLREQLSAQMTDAGIDLWACPAAPGPAPAGLHATGDPNMNLPWTHAGLPAITLPMGNAGESAGPTLPLGLQLVGRFGEDEALLAWAGKLQE